MSGHGKSPGPEENPPKEVLERAAPRAPVSDPTLGIAVPTHPTGTHPHRLVTIGDSMTHGFQSFAISNTHISYPAVVAQELGWYEQFRRPSYPGFGGLPLNLEFIARKIEEHFGPHVNPLELVSAAAHLYKWMDEIEDWWERGPGAQLPPRAGILHNLGIYGWDLRDTLVRTAATCAQEIAEEETKDHMVPTRQLVQSHNARAALRVLDSARDAVGRALTPLGAARALGEEAGARDGIETLVVMLGANNALGTVVQLSVKWSQDDGFEDLKKKAEYTVWAPSHFRSELALLAAEVRNIRARNVLWATVPHVTIAPIAHGVGKKVRKGSRYFQYYTRPWIAPEEFRADHGQDEFITAEQARHVDAAIDCYNDAITETVRAGRNEGRDWYLLELCGLLDSLAHKRYIEDQEAQPEWWQEYKLPPALAALHPRPTTYFYHSGKTGRTAGGLFSLDGVHPTTIAYGIVAQEVIRVMRLAGVEFRDAEGKPREEPVEVDFKNLVALDTLISNPPRSVTSVVKLIGWFDEKFDIVQGVMRSFAVAV